MKLLLVADDAGLAAVVRSWMGLLGASVHWVISGAEVEPALHTGRFNCIVVEQVLPDMRGDEVLRRIRESGFDHPFVVIAASEQVQDRIRVLDMGADDFLVKPIHLGELAARLRALLRRSRLGTPRDQELRHRQIALTPATHVVTNQGKRVLVTNTEFSLLEALLRGKGQVLTRQSLEQALLGQAGHTSSNPVEVHIHHLRRKLGTEFIRTVRGVGYTLAHEDPPREHRDQPLG